MGCHDASRYVFGDDNKPAVTFTGIPLDEPVFLLRGQDLAAPAAIRQWAIVAEHLGSPRETVEQARAVAEEIEEWQKKHQGKVPD